MHLCCQHNGVHVFDIKSSLNRLKKWSAHAVFWHILTSKCASRHNGVHFFDIKMATSKSGPSAGNVLYISLQNVLRATTACTFSTSQLPKVLRTRCVLYHVHFQMCFAPQRRALFNISTSKSSPEHEVSLSLFTSKCASPPQRRAIFHLSSGQLAPHPPL